jgi:sulfite reductase alpha subunit-like flavoprotein
VASSFLASRNIDDKVPIKILKSTFRLPDDPKVPIIMIGAGTGVSPFLGFIEERRHLKSMGDIGPAVLIYGCCSRAAMIGKDQWEKEILDGILDEVIFAFSQETEKRVYDQIVNNFDKLWSMIESGAVVYSCGDVKVGIGVKDAIVRCVAAKTGWTYQRALKYVQDMQQAKRYQRSEWGLQESF